MGTIQRWPFIYMWRHLQATTSLPSALTWSSITFIIHTFNFIIFTCSTLTVWFKTIFNGGCYWEKLMAFLPGRLKRTPFFEVDCIALNYWGKAAAPPGTSTNSCRTYGRFQHLRVTVSPNPSGWKSLLLPSEAWSQESLWDWIPSSRSLYSTPDRLSNLGSATSSIPACANSKFQRSGKEH